MDYTIANSEMVNEKEAQLYTCQSCGKKYIVRKGEAQYFAKGNDRYYCVPCRKAFRAKLEREREELIIPGLFEPSVRTLRATIPENGSRAFR